MAYPNDFQPDSQAADLHQAYDELEKEALESLGMHYPVPAFDPAAISIPD